MNAATVTYAVGDWTALVADEGWALVQCTPDNDSAHALWRLLSAGLRSADLLQALTSSRVIEVPGFAVVLGGESGLALVRGQATARLTDASGREELISAAETSTWTEHALRRTPAALLLSAGGAGGGRATIPTSSGVVASSALAVRWEDAPSVAPPEPKKPRATRKATAKKATAAGHDGVDIAAVPSSPKVAPAVPAAPPSPDMTLVYADRPEVETATSELESDPLAQAQTDSAAEYDDLFGRTEQRAVEDAARRVDEESATEEDAQPAVGTGAPASVEETVVPSRGRVPTALSEPDEASEPGEASESDGLIDAVPWGRQSAPDPTPTRPVDIDHPVPQKPARPPRPTRQPPAVEEDSFEHTMARSSLPVPVAVVSDTMQQSVQAVMCERGHANPPTSSFCRLCGQKIPPQDVRVVPRPSLGELMLPDGTRVVLDRPVLFGRTPSWDGHGDERPNAVQLTSEYGDISRNHVLVSIDEWHVLITDLHSTNGTFLTSPGQEPQRLRAGEAVPMEPGSRVTLSDEVFLVYEVGG